MKKWVFIIAIPKLPELCIIGAKFLVFQSIRVTSAVSEPNVKPGVRQQKGQTLVV